MGLVQKCRRDSTFKSSCAINKSYELELMIMLSRGVLMCKIGITGLFAHF